MVGALPRREGARALAGCRSTPSRANSHAPHRSLRARHPRPGHRRNEGALMSAELIRTIEWTFLAYFAAISIAYLSQCLFAVRRVRRYLKASVIDDFDPSYSTLHLPISLVVPAYNESKSIVTSVKALLQ